jgi:uncharacterized lipoprotein YajG
MTPSFVHFSRTAGLVAILAVWAGCSVTMNAKDVPPLQTASPLNSPRSQSFVLHQFSDQQSRNSPVMLQVAFNKLTLEESPAAMTTAAVQREFERTGHRSIEDGQQSKGDFLVEGTVTQWSLRRDIVNTLTTITGEVEMTITVRPATGGKKTLTKRYRGYHYANGPDLPPRVWKEVLGKAIAASVSSMSMDRDLAAFIHSL